MGRIIPSVPALASFRAKENRDADGVLRVVLLGELDLAVADQLSARLEQLSSDGIPVRLDLSRLEFIDSSGIHALLKAIKDGSADGDRLVEVGRVVGRQIQGVIELTGVAPLLWPAGEPAR